jgi:sugar (pentulose or hexulose) kinase
LRILIVDFGTSSIKASILDEKFNILRASKVSYQIRVYNDDWAELDGPDIFKAMIHSVKILGDDLEDIDLIGFDNFSPSMIFMDEAGTPLYPILTHLDRRSKQQTQDILARMGKGRFQSITGIQPFTGGASITSVMWVQKNEKDIFNKSFKLGHLNTFIFKKLTGLWYSDPVNASMTGMYETISGKGWSEEICATFNIPEKLLPEIRNAGTIGYLTREAAVLCGLKEGIPVAFGTNDAATAQIGADNVSSGSILNISGSSEMVSVLTDHPRIDDQYYLRCSATPGLWQIYATAAGGFALDWFRKEFYRDMDDNRFFNEEFPRVINNFLGKKTMEFLPYLAGDRQSLTPKKAAFTGITLDTKREDFLAAIFMGIHEPITNVIKICETFIPLDNTIKLTGGMINDSFLKVKELLFDAYQFKVIPNCPVIGGAKLALAGLNQKDSTKN